MREAQRMVLAVALQITAAIAWLVGGFLLADVAGAFMAAAVPLFLVGWTLERRHGGL